MYNKNKTLKEKSNKILTIILLTISTMIGEIMYGYSTNSMGLLADGYHMGSHAFSLTITYLTYLIVIKFKNSNYFPYGTNKIETLGAYTSALLLGLSGFAVIIESYKRLSNPIQIKFDEAILISLLGLLINTTCIIIMENPFKKKTKNIKDFNFLAAYYHILADILTSIFAIAGLYLGKFYNLTYIDSVIGLLGGILILKWSINLLCNTVKILIDMEYKPKQ